jgi:hypothetical protein
VDRVEGGGTGRVHGTSELGWWWRGALLCYGVRWGGGIRWLGRCFLSPARRPFGLGLGEGDRLRLNARTPTRVCLLCRCCCAIDRRVGWVPRAAPRRVTG